jgi:hypothetical protein
MKIAGLRSQRFSGCPAADGRRDGGMVVTAPMNDKRQLAGGRTNKFYKSTRCLAWLVASNGPILFAYRLAVII